MMRKTVFAGACLGLTAACALPPQGVSRQDIAAYDTAVASVGCNLVGESDYLPVEFQTGLTRQQVLDITTYKLSSGGAARLADGGVKLTTGACA